MADVFLRHAKYISINHLFIKGGSMTYTARQKSSLWLAMSVLAAVGAMAGQSAFAYTYNWIGPTTGTANWNDAANWSSSDGGSGIPNGVGDTANFTGATLTGALTVNLNQAITIGNLNMSHGGGKNLVIGAGSGGSLIMDNTGTTSATLTSSSASGGTNYFSTNLSVQLNDNLVITANSGLYLEGGNFTGNGNISKIGSTTLNIGRYGTNTYTGTFTVNDNYVASYGDVLSGQASAALWARALGRFTLLTPMLVHLVLRPYSLITSTIIRGRVRRRQP